MSHVALIVGDRVDFKGAVNCKNLQDLSELLRVLGAYLDEEAK